jgi:hypothetical protein
MNTDTNARRFAHYFALPGWRWHHGIHHLQDLQPGYAR